MKPSHESGGSGTSSSHSDDEIDHLLAMGRLGGSQRERVFEAAFASAGRAAPRRRPLATIAAAGLGVAAVAAAALLVVAKRGAFDGRGGARRGGLAQQGRRNGEAFGRRRLPAGPTGDLSARIARRVLRGRRRGGDVRHRLPRSRRWRSTGVAALEPARDRFRTGTGVRAQPRGHPGDRRADAVGSGAGPVPHRRSDHSASARAEGCRAPRRERAGGARPLRRHGAAVIGGRAIAVAAIGLALLAARGATAAEERRYALIVGHNEPPTHPDGGEGLAPLRFADDDAFAFFRFRRELGIGQSCSSRRTPTPAGAIPSSPIGGTAHPGGSRGRGDDPTGGGHARPTPAPAGHSVFSFFFSGHGASGDRRSGGAHAARRARSRGGMLYERVLDRTRRRRPPVRRRLPRRGDRAPARRRGAERVPVAGRRAPTGRGPRSSAFPTSVAPSPAPNGAAHEWEAYQHGVFSHELLVGAARRRRRQRRRRIEYSELSAFLAAANREVADPRARLEAIVQAPAGATRAPLADLTRRPNGRPTGGDPGGGGVVLRRRRSGQPTRRWPPRAGVPDGPQLAGESTAVRPARRRGGRGHSSAGSRRRVRRARLQAASVAGSRRARQLATEGLFLAPFGPSYYLGYADRRDSVAVPITRERAGLTVTRAAPPSRDGRRSLRTALAGAAVGLFVSSGVMGTLALGAWRDNRNSVERDSIAAGERFTLDSSLAAGFLISSIACGAIAALLGRER